MAAAAHAIWKIRMIKSGALKGSIFVQGEILLCISSTHRKENVFGEQLEKVFDLRKENGTILCKTPPSLSNGYLY